MHRALVSLVSRATETVVSAARGARTLLVTNQDLLDVVEAVHALLRVEGRKSDLIIERLADMAAREDAAWERNAQELAAVKEGWDSLVASNQAKDDKIAALQTALDEAGANVSAQVQAALDQDSEADAAKVEAANEALDSLVNPPAPEPAPPADQG